MSLTSSPAFVVFGATTELGQILCTSLLLQKYSCTLYPCDLDEDALKDLDIEFQHYLEKHKSLEWACLTHDPRNPQSMESLVKTHITGRGLDRVIWVDGSRQFGNNHRTVLKNLEAHKCFRFKSVTFITPDCIPKMGSEELTKFYHIQYKSTDAPLTVAARYLQSMGLKIMLTP